MSKDDKCPTDYRNFSGHNEIFNPYQRQGNCEISNPNHDIEKRLTREIIRVIVEALDISWRDRDQFQRLLYSTIHSEVEKLLRQYQDFSVDYVAKEMNSRLDMNEEVEFSHALHAKLSNFFEVFKEWKEKADQLDGGPGETKEVKK